MRIPPDCFARWFCRVIGSMDALTGALLVFAPAFTVSLFGAETPSGDDITMRFVGAFVSSVGLTYLWAADGPGRGLPRILTVWAATAIVRTVVGLFVTGAVIADRLEPPWLAVAITDLGLAAIQFLLVRKWSRR